MSLRSVFLPPLLSAMRDSSIVRIMYNWDKKKEQKQVYFIPTPYSHDMFSLSICTKSQFFTVGLHWQQLKKQPKVF